MDTVPSFAFQDMDASRLDDKMDVASSPYQQPDDFDVELESIRDPSIIGSLHDDMVDDPTYLPNLSSDLMQDHHHPPLPEDEMIDESSNVLQEEQQDLDYVMDAFVDDPPYDDEEILYEDDDTEIAAHENDDAGGFDNAEQPPSHQDVDAPGHESKNEVVPADLDEDHGEEEQNSVDTNIPEVESTNQPGFTTEEARLDTETVQARALDDTANNATEQQAPAAVEEYLDDVYPEPQDHLTEEVNDLHQVELAEEGALAADDQFLALQEGISQEQLPETEKSESRENLEAAEKLQLSATEQITETKAQPAEQVHPVTLVYLEQEMSLFPPMIGDDNDMFFLPTASLAAEPLDKLLAACREVLTGTLEHHDELVLDVAALGLHICEDSKYAAQISLSQILDVYLNLCHNDEGQETRPLYCHLSSRVSLASQYAYLCSAGAEGKTYAEIAADHLDSPEVEGNYADYPEQPQDDDHEESAREETVQEETAQEETAQEEATREEATQEAAQEEQVAGEEANYQPAVTAAENVVAEEPANEVIALSAATPVTEVSAQNPVVKLDLTTPGATAEEPGVVDLDAAPSLVGDYEDHSGEHDQDFDYDGEAPEAYTEGLGQSYPESHDHETNSSHTLEADFADITAHVVDTEKQGELNSFGDSNVQGDGLFDHDESTANGNVDFVSYGDDEIFPENNLDTELAGDFSTIDEAQDPPNVSIDEGDDGLSDNGLSQLPSHDQPPVTPFKSKTTKRKADNEEDFDNLVDFDTPDPKRRRPS